MNLNSFLAISMELSKIGAYAFIGFIAILLLLVIFFFIKSIISQKKYNTSVLPDIDDETVEEKDISLKESVFSFNEKEVENASYKEIALPEVEDSIPTLDEELTKEKPKIVNPFS